MWNQHRNNIPGLTWQDVHRVAVSAAVSRRNAAAIRAAPGSRHAVNARDYAINRGIDRRRGEFEYRVLVVIGTGPGAVESLQIIYTRSKLSADALHARALRMFRADPHTQTHYGRALRALGAGPPESTFVIGASRNPP